MHNTSQRFLLLSSIVIMLFFSCSKDGLFKEISIEDDNVENNRITGFGIGKSRSPEIGRNKAKTSALGNLVFQAAGSDFVYVKSNNSVNFTTKSKGILKNTQLENSYNLSDNKYLSIVSMQTEKRDIDKNNTYLLETEFRTDNLEKTLNEKYKIAVEETILRHYANKTELRGKLYLSAMSLSDYENKPDFVVYIKVLIVVNDTN